MTDNTNADLLLRLDELLDRERTALLSGDFEPLDDILLEKDELFVVLLEQGGLWSEQSIKNVNAKLERNQDLLDSAISGIRSVARRLAAVRRVRQTLEFYDEAGAKSQVEVGIKRSVEKRA